MAQSTDKNPTPKSDERNIVDSAIFSGGDLEDQLTLIWEKNKRFIIYSIAGIFAVFGVYHLSGFMIEQGRLAVQEDYASADDSASKLAFAQKSPETLSADSPTRNSPLKPTKKAIMPRQPNILKTLQIQPKERSKKPLKWVTRWL